MGWAPEAVRGHRPRADSPSADQPPARRIGGPAVASRPGRRFPNSPRNGRHRAGRPSPSFAGRSDASWRRNDDPRLFWFFIIKELMIAQREILWQRAIHPKHGSVFQLQPPRLVPGDYCSLPHHANRRRPIGNRICIAHAHGGQQCLTGFGGSWPPMAAIIGGVDSPRIGRHWTARNETTRLHTGGGLFRKSSKKATETSAKNTVTLRGGRATPHAKPSGGLSIVALPFRCVRQNANNAHHVPCVERISIGSMQQNKLYSSWMPPAVQGYIANFRSLVSGALENRYSPVGFSAGPASGAGSRAFLLPVFPGNARNPTRPRP